MATWVFAEDRAAQIMLAKSNRAKREWKGRRKQGLNSSAPAWVTWDQAGWKPHIFFSRCLQYFWGLQKSESLGSWHSSSLPLQIMPCTVKFIQAKRANLKWVHFPLTVQLFLSQLIFIWCYVYSLQPLCFHLSQCDLVSGNVSTFFSKQAPQDLLYMQPRLMY